MPANQLYTLSLSHPDVEQEPLDLQPPETLPESETLLQLVQPINFSFSRIISIRTKERILLKLLVSKQVILELD
jgi:hypothetical protein